MLKTTFLFVLFILFGLILKAQPLTLSDNAEVSIITIGPGKNLYDKFGHSAFRVKDTIKQIDWVYNYGTYDFNTPNFYTKFAQGKLLYHLSVWNYNPFITHYKNQNRTVVEQVLNLNTTEKNKLYAYLNRNAQPENRDYLYDFLFDNCATKIRDVLVTVFENKIQYSDRLAQNNYSFRQLIQKNVPSNSWGSLGMDVAIGAVVDIKASSWQYQMLPEYVYEASMDATIAINNNNTKPLIKNENVLFKAQDKTQNSWVFLKPYFVFFVIALVIIFITIKDFKNQNRTKILDVFIFGCTAIIGVFLALLWFATNHSSTAQNYNLLWAFPFSLLFIVEVFKNKPSKKLKGYVAFLLLMLALLFIHWFTGVQHFAKGFIPLFIALMIRYSYLFWFIKKVN